MTKLRSLSELYKAVMKLAAACALVSAIAASVSAQQTNTFPSSGNAGVGTTSPITDLEVKNSSSHVGITANSAAGSTDASILFQRGGVNQWFLQSRNSGAPTDSFVIYDAVNFTHPFVLTRSGKVGIGTLSPSGKLEVVSGSGSSEAGVLGMYLGTTNTSHTSRASIGQNYDNLYLVNNAYHAAAGWYAFRTDRTTSKIVLNNYVSGVGSIDFHATNTNNTPDPPLRMTITGAGNVGIGTASPSQLLTVYKGGGATNFYVQSDSGQQAGVYIGDSAQTAIYRPSNTHDLAVYTGGNTNVTFKNTGNVGIGTINPTKKLHVAGDIQVDGNINAKYQDLAEWVPSSEQPPAGTVVVLDTAKSNQVISSTASYDTRVAGVISAQPGITLGEGGEGKVLVATTGRVRVKVDASRGAIQIGDLLVTSDVLGVAMKSEAVNLGGVQFHRPGTIIGKALEPLAKGSGEILVLLSLQ